MSHSPSPWKWQRVVDDKTGLLCAMLLVTTRSTSPFADPCVLALREDWIDYFDRSEKGQANGRVIAAAPTTLTLLTRFYEQTYGKTDLLSPLDFEQARAVIKEVMGT